MVFKHFCHSLFGESPFRPRIEDVHYSVHQPRRIMKLCPVCRITAVLKTTHKRSFCRKYSAKSIQEAFKMPYLVQLLQVYQCFYSP